MKEPTVKECNDCRTKTEGCTAKLIGHALKTHVMVLLLLKWIKLKPLDPADQDKLDAVLKAVPSLNGLISIFDNFTESPRLTMRKDLYSLIEQVLEIEKDFRIEFGLDFSPHLNEFALFFDGARISFCLLNIITNAKEAILTRIEKEGKNYKGRLNVSVGKKDGAKEFFITIKNNGEKIPDKLLRKIFNLSFTTKDVEGGFGLTFVAHTVEQHGGKIEVKSTKDETIFTIFLPIR